MRPLKRLTHSQFKSNVIKKKSCKRPCEFHEKQNRTESEWFSLPNYNSRKLEIENIVRKLKVKNSSGVDGISIEFKKRYILA